MVAVSRTSPIRPRTSSSSSRLSSISRCAEVISRTWAEVFSTSENMRSRSACSDSTVTWRETIWSSERATFSSTCSHFARRSSKNIIRWSVDLRLEARASSCSDSVSIWDARFSVLATVTVSFFARSSSWWAAAEVSCRTAATRSSSREASVSDCWRRSSSSRIARVSSARASTDSTRDWMSATVRLTCVAARSASLRRDETAATVIARRSASSEWVASFWKRSSTSSIRAWSWRSRSSSCLRKCSSASMRRSIASTNSRRDSIDDNDSPMRWACFCTRSMLGASARSSPICSRSSVTDCSTPASQVRVSDWFSRTRLISPWVSWVCSRAS